jgi:type II restriction/modification system DNA methylase subunit YeeA
MQTGGHVGFEQVEWFNGGLFDDDAALPLDRPDIADLIEAARLDWSQIDPSILGTLFERGLDPAKRSQLGAHYTDRDKIMKIVTPVVIDPLLAEWAKARERIAGLMDRERDAKSPSAATVAYRTATQVRTRFLERLKRFRVLDPACGSGNFLYLALRALKDMEHRANLDAEALGLPRGFPQVGPEAVLGIELNPYAAELARVSVWIGEIQWMRANGFEAGRDPILRPLDTIECRDALLTSDRRKARWPKADVVIGNPPFLGGKLMRRHLGDDYVDALFAAHRGLVRPEADLVMYWIARAGALVGRGDLAMSGLVTSNSARGGPNRATLANATMECRIVEAWSDEEWTLDGAAVRVSLVCLGRQSGRAARLNGREVERILPDLTPPLTGAVDVDLTRAAKLAENRGVAFMGDTKGGPFDVPGELAREWLVAPLNPNGRPNADVLKPWRNGMDLVSRASDRWIIDFGWTMSEAEAALYEAPYQYSLSSISPSRKAQQARGYAKHWWVHERARPEMWAALEGLTHYIATPRVAKYRLFQRLPASIVPDSQLIVVARDDDTTFGILHSRFHEVWSLRMGTWLGVGNDPRYTPSTTFETFPFPDGLTPDIPADRFRDELRARLIASAARNLEMWRSNWLQPSDLVRRVPEVVSGYPDRLLPVDDKAAEVLKSRTLTKLYNARPAWLDLAHRRLDEAVADAYGWGDDWRAGRLDDDDILARLFRLNQDRAAGARAQSFQSG